MKQANHRSTLRGILTLGWPMFVSQLAVMAHGIIDTAMAGHLSARDLAAVAIGSSVYYMVYVGLMGALQAISPVAAQHFGAGRLHAVGDTWRQGQWMAVLLFAPAALALAMPQPLPMVELHNLSAPREAPQRDDVGDVQLAVGHG